MKQIYYAIQSTLHGRGSNVTKVISLSLGLTIGVLLFSQIAFELNYEKCKSLCKNHPDRRSDPRSCCSGRLLKE